MNRYNNFSKYSVDINVKDENVLKVQAIEVNNLVPSCWSFKNNHIKRINSFVCKVFFLRSLIFISLFLICNVAMADFCEDARDDDYLAIRNSLSFLSERVGIMAVEPMQNKEFECIVKEPEREDIFESLLWSSEIGGQLYGLKGLYDTNLEKYLEYSSYYKNDETMIFTHKGCFILPTAVRDLVRSVIEGGMPRWMWERENSLGEF